MQRFPEDWSLQSKVEFLQRKILLNSIAYYNYDTSFLDDSYYDSLCRQLVVLHDEFIKTNNLADDTPYGYVFYDFDGSTGFHLYERLKESDKSYLNMIAESYISSKSREGSFIWK